MVRLGVLFGWLAQWGLLCTWNLARARVVYNKLVWDCFPPLCHVWCVCFLAQVVYNKLVWDCCAVSNLSFCFFVCRCYMTKWGWYSVWCVCFLSAVDTWLRGGSVVYSVCVFCLQLVYDQVGVVQFIMCVFTVCSCYTTRWGWCSLTSTNSSSCRPSVVPAPAMWACRLYPRSLATHIATGQCCLY